ncbi:MAG: DUF1501 domain-containing protein [Planctomycetes bacterium]|nr:DUF1501 domain-containing protein [Planctomycetota bacterium]
MPLDPRVLSRRHFLRGTAGSLGALALAELATAGAVSSGVARVEPPRRAKARRVIYLFQSGGPSQLETFDYKPVLNARNGEPLPDSVRQGQRLTGMSGNQSLLPLAGSQFRFAQHGCSRQWVSELFPRTAGVVDELCFVKSLHTEAINHDPAITFLCTGSEIAGRPSMGAWLSYGLGSPNRNLPAFVVLVTKKGADQPLYARLWGSGFLPSEHQGVQFLAGKEPVLYLANPDGVSATARRRQLDALGELAKAQHAREGDDEILARLAQAEMAFRMQTSVPEVTDLSDEPDEVFELYGADARTPGTYAANCLLARRLAERGVRFVQLFHPGWDHHGDLPASMRNLARETDQASAALIVDLKRRGLLDDTLVVWGGEFGRTNYSQGKLTSDNYGRDHHPRCFTAWLAGAGVNAGTSFGETDEFGYNIARDPVHVHDFHATLLHLLGVDHTALTFRYQGRDFRLTDVAGRVVHELLS